MVRGQCIVCTLAMQSVHVDKVRRSGLDWHVIAMRQVHP